MQPSEKPLSGFLFMEIDINRRPLSGQLQKQPGKNTTIRKSRRAASCL